MVHLSTLMCPMHRKEILRWIKIWQKKKKRVCCVSTALIEAGINVSFPVVIRSLAGIPSIIQAAGRCNRNCEADYGTVYLWNFSEERLGRLPSRLGRASWIKILTNVLTKYVLLVYLSLIHISDNGFSQQADI